MKCINSGGQHSSRSHNCPMYKQEVVVQEVHTLKEVSYLDVKKLVLRINGCVIIIDNESITRAI